MAKKSAEKLLLTAVGFLKKTSHHHRKKLIVLIVITILSYIAKKKLRLAHLFYLAQKISKVAAYLPLPTFPQYRKLNRYESVTLHPLLNEIINAMNIQEIKANIKLKKSDWNELKQSIMSGAILSAILYNVQTFYFIVQNKYESDFRDLNAIEVFERMMGQIRTRFSTQIPVIKQILSNLLLNEIQKIDIKSHYSLDQYFAFIDQMVDKVFSRKYLLVKEENQLLENNFYRSRQYFKIAQNYFLTPMEYIPQKSSKFEQITSKISRFTSKFHFRIFREVVCEVSQERFEWAKIAYRIPLKKSLSYKLQWPNRQSQELSKLVIDQMGQVISSVNFSTILFQNAKLNAQILKNRLFLYFGKNSITNLRAAQSLAVFYKLLKQQILIGSPHSSSIKGQSYDKRQTFYESEILKAIRHKRTHEQSLLQVQSNVLLIKEQKMIESQPVQEQLLNRQQQQSNQLVTDINPEIFLLNMHLQEIYQSKQLAYLVKEFQIKYFNERSNVTINPKPKAGGGTEKPGDQDEIKNLLNLLGSNQELNRKD